MKKLLFLVLPMFLFAKSFVISNITLPKTYIQNLDPYECHNECMRNYLKQGMIFSFLAHAEGKLLDKELDDARVMNIAILNIGAFNVGGELKIALLIPYKKIGKYASSTVNATFAYLMTKGNPFVLKSYRIKSEEVQEIDTVLQKIHDDGFEYVIAPLTKDGVSNIVKLNTTLHIYFPTINKNDINTTVSNYFFGGIDYKAQSKKLLKEAHSPLVIFSDRSKTGKRLAIYQEKEFLHPTKSIEEKVEEDGVFGSFFDEPSVADENSSEKKVIKYFISRKRTNLEYYLKENDKIVNGSFFLNTPIIKSGMILSQLTLYDANATNILSTQINYNPLLLSMTQYIDREKMIIANSIIQNNTLLIETNSLLGNDIVYDWINYTTTVGVDYFYSEITGKERDYNINVDENQMVYDIELVHPGRTKFLPFIPSGSDF